MTGPRHAFLLMGTHMHPCGESAMSRQRNGLASIAQFPECHAVNLQFSHDWQPLDFPGLETLSVLDRDSRTVSGADGVRKPIYSDVFHQLAKVAKSGSIPYFGFINSDIVLLRPMLDEVLKGSHECYMASRKDIDANGVPQAGHLVQGVELWIMSLKFYEREGWRLPAAIVGEFGGDNLCASIALTHGDGFLINHRTVCLHEMHETRWFHSPFDRYNHLVCIEHGYYFTTWARYIATIEAHKNRSMSDADALQVQKACFARKPNALDRAACKLKLAKWKGIYWWKRRRLDSDRKTHPNQ